MGRAWHHSFTKYIQGLQLKLYLKRWHRVTIINKIWCGLRKFEGCHVSNSFKQTMLQWHTRNINYKNLTTNL